MFMPFSVEIFSDDNDLVVTDLVITPTFYSASAVGGSLRAELNVSGGAEELWDILEWLNYQVVIRNGNGTVVWNGIIMEATVNRTSLTVGASIERMANRVAIVYNYTGPTGEEVQGRTDWASDDVSTALYGVKEKIFSMPDTKESVAEAKRDTYLASLKDPIPILEFEGVEGGATIVCVGLWETTDWVYYENTLGKEEYNVSASDDHGIGWQLAATTIGFSDKGIYDKDARFFNYPADTQIKVSGSASNNTVYTIGSAPDEERDEKITYTASTISFDPSDDILDSANGLGGFASGEMIKTSGAVNAPNNDYFWVKTTGTNRIEISGGVLVSGSAGPAITIEQGHHLTTDETVNFEKPGALVTLRTRGGLIAQEFTISAATAWSCKEIELNVGAGGTPADQLRVSLYTKSAGVPTTELAFGLLSADDVGGDTDWVSVTLNTAVTLSPGVSYFITAFRTGATSNLNFWLIGMETSETSEPPALILDDSTYVQRTPVSCLPYRLWSLKETSAIIGNMLTSTGKFSHVSVQLNSGLEERDWREGDQKAMQEIKKLVESGTATGKKIFIRTLPGKAVIVYQEPDPSIADPIYTAGGQLRDPYRADWEVGVLPAGMYVRLEGVPAHVGARRFLQSVLIDEAEYDIQSNSYRLTPWAMDKDMEI